MFHLSMIEVCWYSERKFLLFLFRFSREECVVSFELNKRKTMMVERVCVFLVRITDEEDDFLWNF